jgi:hypothetical protein
LNFTLSILKPFENLFGVNFADFCQKALSEVARKILNCFWVLAHVFKIGRNALGASQMPQTCKKGF